LQLLHEHIPKAKKNDDLSVFFALLGATGVKAARKKFMKLTPGLNIINILSKAFTHADPKWVKMTVKLSIFFTLLVSTSAKVACKMLMKLTPDKLMDRCTQAYANLIILKRIKSKRLNQKDPDRTYFIRRCLLTLLCRIIFLAILRLQLI